MLRTFQMPLVFYNAQWIAPVAAASAAADADAVDDDDDDDDDDDLHCLA